MASGINITQINPELVADTKKRIEAHFANQKSVYSGKVSTSFHDAMKESEEGIFGMNVEGSGSDGVVEAVFASGIDDALEALNPEKPAIDLHPEKRRNALYKAFEEQMLSTLRTEQPGLRRTQYLERVHALWLKSEQNPDNAIYL